MTDPDFDNMDLDADSPEDGFMRGYSSEEIVEVCSECGSALEEENKIKKEFDGDVYQFCSDSCLDDFEESI